MQACILYVFKAKNTTIKLASRFEAYFLRGQNIGSQQAQAAGIHSVPTILIGGEQISGAQPATVFTQALLTAAKADLEE